MAARRLEVPGAVLLPTRTGARARAELSIAAIATVCLSLCVRYKYPRGAELRLAPHPGLGLCSTGLGYVFMVIEMYLWLTSQSVFAATCMRSSQRMIYFLGEAV